MLLSINPRADFKDYPKLLEEPSNDFFIKFMLETLDTTLN
jgi:hypothetical protein